MRKFVLSLALVVAASAGLRLIGEEQVPTAWFGTWTLNVAASTYDPGPPPYRRASYRIEPWGDGAVKVTYDMVHPRGGVSHLEWIGRFDGRDYPVHGIDEFMSYAYHRRDDGSYEVTVKVDGRRVATSAIRLSADGRTMTTTTVGTNAGGRRVETITVYEKEGE